MPVYDDQNKKTSLGTLPGNDELEAITGMSPSEQSDVETRARAGADQDLAEKREAERLKTATGGESEDKGAGGGFYKGNPSPASPGAKSLKTRLSGMKNIAGGKNKLMIGFGIGALLALAILILFIASLMIPHLAENITGWQFSRSARQFRISQSQIDGQKIALDTADDGLFNSMKQKYSNLRENYWGKLDQYRPQKVFENLKSEGILTYEYDEGRLLRRPRLTAVVVNGERIPYNKPTIRGFFTRDNYRERVKFTAAMDGELEVAMRRNNTLVRSSVMKTVYEDLGLKQLGLSKRLREYRGLKAEQIDLALQRENIERTWKDTTRSSIKDIAEAQGRLESELHACLDDPKCAKEWREGDGTVPKAITENLENDLKPTTSARALSTASLIYAIAVPLCIVYEGSIHKAKPAIDSENAQLQKSYQSLVGPAEQLEKGELTTQATAAVSRRWRHNVARSVPLRRAAGQTVNTEDEVKSPHSGGSGEFTALTLLLGDNPLGRTASAYADFICPKITDLRVAAAVTIAELTAGFFSGGSSTVSEQGLKVFVVNRIGEITAKMSVKGALKRGGIIALQAGAIAGATLLAKSLVEMGVHAQSNGGSRGEELAVQADMGGNLQNGQEQQQVFYGRPMTSNEVVDDVRLTVNDLQSQEAKKTAFERYLSPQNPRSLLTTTSTTFSAFLGDDNGIPGFVQRLATMASSSLSNPFFAFASTNNSAQALTGAQQNYGIVQIGYSMAENDLIKNNTSYSPLENSKILEESGKKDDIEEEYKTCFEDSFGTLISEERIVRNEKGDVISDKGKCSPKNLGTRNPKYGDLVFRYRVSKMYDNSLDHLKEIQDPDTGDGSGGSGALASQLPTGPVDESQIAPVKGLTTGCHTSIAEKANDMMEAARRDGVILTGSCWRDSAKQILLRKQNCPDWQNSKSSDCSPPTAKPGTSNHEKGLAIDFGNCGRGSTCFNWLSKNAATYGFKNLPSESWHWSVNGQ